MKFPHGERWMMERRVGTGEGGQEGGWWGGHYISALEERRLARNKAFNQECLHGCHILFGVKGSNRNQRETSNRHAKPWFHLHTGAEIMHSITYILNLRMYVYCNLWVGKQSHKSLSWLEKTPIRWIHINQSINQSRERLSESASQFDSVPPWFATTCRAR